MDKTQEILDLLKINYPDAKTQLNFKGSFQCLVAVILSARTTDEQVNRITPSLFLSYADPYRMAAANSADVENIISKCGLYKNKSRNLINTAKMLVSDYNGKVPNNMEDLLKLPGVGRKTANVVISTLFGQAAMPVDTHVLRVSYRLGLTKSDKPEKVEKDLMSVIPQNLWSETHHRLINHGRIICNARKPSCQMCFLQKICCQKKFIEV